MGGAAGKALGERLHHRKNSKTDGNAAEDGDEFKPAGVFDGVGIRADNNSSENTGLLARASVFLGKASPKEENTPLLECSSNEGRKTPGVSTGTAHNSNGFTEPGPAGGADVIAGPCSVNNIAGASVGRGGESSSAQTEFRDLDTWQLRHDSHSHGHGKQLWAPPGGSAEPEGTAKTRDVHDHLPQSQPSNLYDDVSYGRLVVLGYKKYEVVSGRKRVPSGNPNAVFECRRRKTPNGIKRNALYEGNAADYHRSEHATHTISFNLPKDASSQTKEQQMVSMEFIPDGTTDMFQVGRLDVEENDLVTCGPFSRGLGGNVEFIVSRYAVRLLISRTPPFTCECYAAGFDKTSHIFLGEGAAHWNDDEIGWDAGVTNAIRMWNPSRRVWREVSVNGRVFKHTGQGTGQGTSAIESRPAEVGERSILVDGSIIDIGGVYLLYKQDHDETVYDEEVGSAESKLSSEEVIARRKRREENRRQKEQVLAAQQAAWLPGPLRRFNEAGEDVYIFPSTGHVVTSADRNGHPERGLAKVLDTPFCADITSEPATHCFSPCGCISSLEACQTWSRIPLAHLETKMWKPCCPVCAEPLACNTDAMFKELCFDDLASPEGDGGVSREKGAAGTTESRKPLPSVRTGATRPTTEALPQLAPPPHQLGQNEFEVDVDGFLIAGSSRSDSNGQKKSGRKKKNLKR